MTDRTRRQVYLLALLLAVLAGVLYVSLRGGGFGFGAPATAPAAARTQASNERAPGSGTQNVPVTDVRLDALQQTGEALTPSERNPFRFQARALPPPPRSVRPAEPQDTFVPPPQQTGPPPPPPIPLRYVGLLGAPSQPDRIAVLSDARGNPFYGKEGDIIEGRYRVLRIAPDSVDVAYADGRGRQTLRLSAQ